MGTLYLNDYGKGQQSDQCENSLHIKTNEMLKQTLILITRG